MKKLIAGLAVLVSLGFGLPAVAAEPTMHEIYQAADAGKMDEAQRMIREVLQAHPNSGKAHYVEAELLAKQGKARQAAGELATAERLAPGLPFASAPAVASLRQVINSETVANPPVEHARALGLPAQPAPQAAASGFPWSLVLAGVFLIAFIAWAVRFMTRQNASTQAGYGGGSPGYRPAYPAGYPQGPYGGAPAGYGPAPAAPGLGSGILGGLATGAAVGAGVVVGEELLHHVLDGQHSSSGNNAAGYQPFQSIPDDVAPRDDDMGGNDFGIADNSSWDDSSSGGGGDWN
jgi:hypothetical protein